MNKRQFLVLAIAAIGPLKYSTRLFADPSLKLEMSEYDIIAKRLRPMFKNPKSAQVIGSRFLKDYSGNIEDLGLLEQIGVSVSDSNPELSFQKKREKDFLAGNTMNINGWVLAKSEICVCALIALT